MATHDRRGPIRDSASHSTYDHCVVFIVRDTFFAEAENRWLDVLYSMSYEQRPYLLTRAMYVPSVSARDFPSEEAPGRDVVGMLREEIEELESEGSL